MTVNKTIESSSNHLELINLYAAKNFSEALRLASTMTTLDPSYRFGWTVQGAIFQQSGQLDAALSAKIKAVELAPSDAVGQYNLGNLYMHMGKVVEATKCYKDSIQINPNFVEALTNLAGVQKSSGNLIDAEITYREAIRTNPKHINALNNLGVLLNEMGQIEEAERIVRTALNLSPNNPEISNNLGVILVKLRRLVEAVDIFKAALLHDPESAELHNNLGEVLTNLGENTEAKRHLEIAILIRPLFWAPHNNLGIAYQREGDYKSAISHFREALKIEPKAHNVHSNLLFCMTFSEDADSQGYHDAALEYESKFGAPRQCLWPIHQNSKEFDRKLRIGYVSPDFRDHPVAYFFEPILLNHDKERFEVFCYSESIIEDEYTKKFKQVADCWRSTVGLIDEIVSQQIADDRIDILIDLAGHTKDNRLLVFACKPAPIQISYLGFAANTGLKAIDYRLTDNYVCSSPGYEGNFDAPGVLKIAPSSWCFAPRDMPQISLLPALRRGNITFGSINNFSKVDGITLDLWARLLQKIPSARLMILTIPDGEAVSRVSQHFAKFGVENQRIDFIGRLNKENFQKKILEIDISLDPLNVNGGTTTCESLWLGVPVISMIGERMVSRAGYSILSAAGLTQFIARSSTEYIEIASHFTSNLDELANIRTNLRTYLKTTLLMDHVGFTRKLENIYRNVWYKWCERA